jgi:hypothetical protein
MKLLQTIVSGCGFREPDHNPTRLELLDKLLAVATKEDANLVMLPCGYLTVGSEQEMSTEVVRLTDKATSAGVAVAVGIDLPETRAGKGGRSPRLPYFGLVCGAVSGGPWQQTSSTGENAADVAEENVPGKSRVVTVRGCRVGVLICGELFSWGARESFAGLALGLAIDLGHYGMGTGVTKAMENIARKGKCAVAHTHHVASWGSQSLHFVRSNAMRKSVPLADCHWLGDDDFWIAWCIRTI